MELNKILARVRQLVAMAEAEIAPGATEVEREHTLREQQQAREMADALMLRYSIDEAMAEQARPVGERSKPGTIEIVLGGDRDLEGWITTMAGNIARHCRCMIRNYTRYDSEQQAYVAKVYGFESDLRYFEMLYTTLRLHMVGVLAPRISSTESLEENCYRLHAAGFNWLEIAGLYGWRKYESLRISMRRDVRISFPEVEDIKVAYWNREAGEVQPATQVGSRYKRAYYRAVAARGEQPTQIPAGGSKSYRYSAAQGYVGRITRRLKATEATRDPGAGIVLRSRTDDLDALFRQDNPDLFREHEPALECEACEEAKSGHCRQHPRISYKPAPYSAAGFQAGVAHANTADLSPKTEASRTRALG